MIEIMFSDLNEKIQKEVLKEFGYKSEQEGNWDTFPLFVLECEKD